MKKINVKTVIVSISDEARLNRINNTFALKSLFPSGVKLKVGENQFNVNHANFSALERMQTTMYILREI